MTGNGHGVVQERCVPIAVITPLATMASAADRPQKPVNGNAITALTVVLQRGCVYLCQYKR
jgi:hypothetical protein